MPEIPDLDVYLSALTPRIIKQPIDRCRLRSVFVLRSVRPRLSAIQGLRVMDLKRQGKRIVFVLENDLYLVFHLMIAGRFRWRAKGHPVPKRNGLLALDFPTGTLLFTETGTKKRASLYLVSGAADLHGHDRGGLEVQTASTDLFHETLTRENRTLKRALTDPRILSGIGNAYSDEILHRGRYSPFVRTGSFDPEESSRLQRVIIEVLVEWTQRLLQEVGDGFPEKVTAFRPEMAVHGRFQEPCPECGSPVQRILYAENEANYCVTCQTGGKLLADRVLSRLMKDDWPKTLEELEERRSEGHRSEP